MGERFADLVIALVEAKKHLRKAEAAETRAQEALDAATLVRMQAERGWFDAQQALNSAAVTEAAR